MPSTWVTEWSKGAEYIEHLDGTCWFDTKKPWRFHRCRPQTRGMIQGTGQVLYYTERCRCGGIRMTRPGYENMMGWAQRNSRKKT